MNSWPYPPNYYDHYCKLLVSDSSRLSQLTSEIQQKDDEMSPIELFLLDKFNAEIGYCNVALLKAGIGITQELKGLVETGRKHIEKYESDLLKNREDFQERVAGTLRAENLFASRYNEPHDLQWRPLISLSGTQ